MVPPPDTGHDRPYTDAAAVRTRAMDVPIAHPATAKSCLALVAPETRAAQPAA